MVTFGGNYSNHLAALATASRRYTFPLHCCVRGEPVTNPVIDYVASRGPALHWLSRSDYRAGRLPPALASLPGAVLIPAGGTTPAALPYTGEVYAEIVAQLGRHPDYCCLSMGTGGTAAGTIRAAAGTPARVEVFPALRGDWPRAALEELTGPGHDFTVVSDYHFGGYARYPARWRRDAPRRTAPAAAAVDPDLDLPLEPVYTAKLFAGVLDRLRRAHYPRGSTLVVVHTGGIY